jgi:DNA-directed RNA polymerase specialized sigma24 family protein
MARSRYNDDSGDQSRAIVPFWLRQDYEGRDLVDERVLTVAKDNWQWAVQLISRSLHDAPQTPAIVESVAADVTRRLRESPEVGRKLNAYFRTALIHRVKSMAARDHRISYQGTTLDLDAVHRPAAPDLSQVFEDRMTLEAIVPHLSGLARQILELRLLDYSWKEVANEVHLTEKQAKTRFYYGLRQAYEIHMAAQSKKRGERKLRNGE